MSRKKDENNVAVYGCLIVIVIMSILWSKWSDYSEARYQRSPEGQAAARERQLDKTVWVGYCGISDSEFKAIERVIEKMQQRHGFVIWRTLSAPPEINVTTSRRYYYEFVAAVRAAGVNAKPEAVFED